MLMIGPRLCAAKATSAEGNCQENFVRLSFQVGQFHGVVKCRDNVK